MNTEETRTILNAIIAYYPSFQVHRMSLKAWQAVLANEAYEDVKAGLLAYTRHGKFAPTVADILEQVRHLKAAQANEMTAEEAFAMVLESVARHGYYRETDAQRSLPEHIWQTVKTIGWKNICLSNISEQGTLRAQFRNAYNGIQERKEKQKKFVDVMQLTGETMKLIEKAGGNGEG